MMIILIMTICITIATVINYCLGQVLLVCGLGPFWAIIRFDVIGIGAGVTGLYCTEAWSKTELVQEAAQFLKHARCRVGHATMLSLALAVSAVFCVLSKSTLPVFTRHYHCNYSKAMMIFVGSHHIEGAYKKHGFRTWRYCYDAPCVVSGLEAVATDVPFKNLPNPKLFVGKVCCA